MHNCTLGCENHLEMEGHVPAKTRNRTGPVAAVPVPDPQIFGIRFSDTVRSKIGLFLCGPEKPVSLKNANKNNYP